MNLQHLVTWRTTWGTEPQPLFAIWPCIPSRVSKSLNFQPQVSTPTTQCLFERWWCPGKHGDFGLAAATAAAHCGSVLWGRSKGTGQGGPMTQWLEGQGLNVCGLINGLSLMALKMATFDRDVDFWRSYGAGGRNSVEKIELEAETQSWIDVGNGHVVHQMTQKIVALSSISRPRIYCSFLLTFLTLCCFFYGLGLFIFKVKSRMPACVSLHIDHTSLFVRKRAKPSKGLPSCCHVPGWLN